MNKTPFYSICDNYSDCDPDDCNRAPKEFAETATEFGATPTEEVTTTYRNDVGGYTGTEIETPAESNAMKNIKTATNFFNAPGIIAPLGAADAPDNATDSETSTEFDWEYNDAYTSPDDETAATIDEYYTTSSAEERCRLDDYEIISDVLGSEKQLVKLYSTALCESAEEPLRNIIRDNLYECANDQFATFEYMQKRGMYPTEEAPQETIDKAKQQFTPLCDNGCCHH